ncbi:hypothetical protein [Nitrosomonas sp. wSCUT-2]
MEGLIGLAIFLFFVYLVVRDYWEYLLLVIPIIGFIWFILDQMKKAKIADEKQKQYQREEEARVLAQTDSISKCNT